MQSTKNFVRGYFGLIYVIKTIKLKIFEKIQMENLL